MQAWQIQDDHTIKLASMTTPEPGPDQVRVKVRAMGVNRADILQVKGLYPAPPGFDSSVPGLEYAGEIEAVGSQVMGRKVGDRVMGLIPGCAYSEYLVTHERETLTLPDEIDFATGATIPEAFLTAYRAMFLEGGLQPGQWVLVRPATAGVGLAGVQLANALGQHKPSTLSYYEHRAAGVRAGKRWESKTPNTDNSGPRNPRRR